MIVVYERYLLPVFFFKIIFKNNHNAFPVLSFKVIYLFFIKNNLKKLLKKSGQWAIGGQLVGNFFFINNFFFTLFSTIHYCYYIYIYISGQWAIYIYIFFFYKAIKFFLFIYFFIIFFFFLIYYLYIL